MKRRDFLRTSLLSSGTLLVPSFLKGFEYLLPQKLSGFKRLVVIQFSGGNDGLNTVIPHQNDIYYRARPSLSIPSTEVIKLTDQIGLNPNMKALQPLFDNGEMAILNNVGYPNPNRSHFRSMDIWHSASNEDEYLSTGWLGRYLDANCEKPWESLEISRSLSLAMKGQNRKAIAVENANLLYQSTRSPFFDNVVANTNAEMLDEDNMGYLYKTMIETHSSAKYIQEKSKIYKSTTDYPQNGLGKQLKSVAEFIVSGLESKVYYVPLSGFDTHAGQKSRQGKLLEQYADGVAAFVGDLKKNDCFKDTLILTFSEFGRRVAQNASQGTDHGTASNIFLFGGSLKQAGVLNEAANLSDLSNGDLKHTVDFRSVYATILNKWLEADDKALLNNRSFEQLNFV